MPGPLFANLILADEINRTPPKTQSALLEAMQEQTVTSMGKPYRLRAAVLSFSPLKTRSSRKGTYPLPEAQLDRFMFSLWMGYPSRKDFIIVLATTEEVVPVVEPVCLIEQITAFQHLRASSPRLATCREIRRSLARSSRPVYDGCPPLCAAIRFVGRRPRASQHMILGAEALAVLDGEPTVSARHIRQVAPQVLRHRVLPNYNAAGEGVDAAAIVRHLLEKTAEPSYAN